MDKAKVEPWAEMLAILKGAKNGDKLFAYVQRHGNGLVGFIIAGWDDLDHPIVFLNYASEWQVFNDETAAEYPKIYVSRSGAETCINRLEREDESIAERRMRNIQSQKSRPTHIGLVFWKHKDADAEPLAKYLNMAEIQFPGCPTQ